MEKKISGTLPVVGLVLTFTALTGLLAAEKMGYIQSNELSQSQKDMLERRCTFGCG